jgi:tetratricopeptide (TPR) repeat protein
MKSLINSVLLAISVTGAVQAQAATEEIGYPQDAIGYDALMSGDNERAIGQILSNRQISRHDPARLINLGQAYARTGRIYEAQQMFSAALNKREQVDLVLADGRVINSRDAARQALAKLQATVASR